MPEINPTVRRWSAINPDVWKDAIADAYDRGRIQGQADVMAIHRDVLDMGLADKIDGLLEALRFYADPDSYVWRDDDTVPVLQDAGTAARDALKTYERDDDGGME